MARTESQHEAFLSLLEGESCDFCREGTLEQRTYKGTDAVVCDSCGTPGARSW